MDRSTESVEELLELLWTAEEDQLTPLDRHRLPETLRCFDPHPMTPDSTPVADAVDAAAAEALVCLEGPWLSLTAAGRFRAERVVRRHRLTENLLAGVLSISDESVEATACQMEHILNEEVTDAVCAFLGHPPVCPHSRAIPRGACCLRAAAPIEPLIVPLEQLPVGQMGRVAFIHTPRHGYRQRLSLLGLVPGSTIVLRQLLPTPVVALGHTELALDRQAGQEIFVRRRNGCSEAG